jgi:hypothetical protein
VLVVGAALISISTEQRDPMEEVAPGEDAGRALWRKARQQLNGTQLNCTIHADCFQLRSGRELHLNPPTLAEFELQLADLNLELQQETRACQKQKELTARNMKGVQFQCNDMSCLQHALTNIVS